MTPDKNNFQFRNDGSKEAIEAIKLLGLTYDIDYYQYYGRTSRHRNHRFGSNDRDSSLPEITPSEALALLRDTPATTTMLQELDFKFTEWAAQNYVRLYGCWIGKYSNQTIKENQKSTQEVYDHYLQIRGILPKSVTKHTAPQVNLEEVERLILELADRYARDYGHEENPNFKDSVAKYAAIFRKLIGYTLDANGKPKPL